MLPRATSRMTVLTLALWVGAASAAVKVAGVQFPDTEEVAQQHLLINGAGVRVKMVFDVYAASLYLPQKASDAQGVLTAPGPKSVQAVLLRHLTAEEFVDALLKGYKANNSEADQEKYKSQLQTLEGLMLGMKSAPKGSHVKIDLIPGQGTRISLNGKKLGAHIPGDDFYVSLLKIWLGNKPVDSDLKSALLGKP